MAAIKLLLTTICVLALPLALTVGQSITTEFCGTARKGCIRSPPECDHSALEPHCTQLVTWETSPFDDESLLIKMFTNTTKFWNAETGDIEFKDIDYIAFGLADAPENFMNNGSIVACVNTGYVGLNLTYSHNSDFKNKEINDSTVGLYELVSFIANDFIMCEFQRKIHPQTENQFGTVFPLDQSYNPAWAVGPYDVENMLGYHDKSKEPFDSKVRLTDVVPMITLDECGKTKGCLMNPQGCTSTEDCQQLVTYQVSPTNASRVRFEMFTANTFEGQRINYIAFGLASSPNQFMSNASTFICGEDNIRNNMVPYLAHNSGGKANRLDDKLQTGIEFYQGQIGSDYLACIFEKDIKPSADQHDLVFDLDAMYYPAWAAGPNAKNGNGDMTGTLTHHFVKQPYYERINVVESKQILTTTTTAEPTTMTTTPDGASQITSGTFLLLAGLFAAATMY